MNTTPTGCGHRLNGGPLACTNPRPHQPGRGCTYASATGSWVTDRHADGGQG